MLFLSYFSILSDLREVHVKLLIAIPISHADTALYSTSLIKKQNVI